jgi:hypothetical protein
MKMTLLSYFCDARDGSTFCPKGRAVRPWGPDTQILADAIFLLRRILGGLARPFDNQTHSADLTFQCPTLFRILCERVGVSCCPSHRSLDSVSC